VAPENTRCLGTAVVDVARSALKSDRLSGE
jgi:hypothetical protein